MERIETTILRNLIHNEAFVRKASPFLKKEYFSDQVENLIYSEISNFINKYSNNPSFSALQVILTEKDGVPESIYEELSSNLDGLKADVQVEIEWLLDATEQFCKRQALYNAISQCVVIMDGKDKKHSPEIMPSLLTDALGVSFDTNVGHDYIEDAEDRYSYFSDEDKSPRIPFDIDILNAITKGGFKKKTLNVFLAGTNVGKSLVMCHLAAANLSQGKNVLYITLEMGEEEIAQRIDANRMGVDMSEIDKISKDIFMTRMGKIKEKTEGKLIIKEYPTSSASVIHFKSLLNELKIKKKFIPDIIYIDYINICASSRQPASQTNTNILIKAITEELRSLAQEYELPIVSATQTNRGAQSASDLNLEDTGESIGLTQTADFILGLVCTEDMSLEKRMLCIQLKSRYRNKDKDKRFMVGIDKDKMKLFNMDNHGFQHSRDVPEQDTKFRQAKATKDFSGIKL